MPKGNSPEAGVVRGGFAFEGMAGSNALPFDFGARPRKRAGRGR